MPTETVRSSARGFDKSLISAACGVLVAAIAFLIVDSHERRAPLPGAVAEAPASLTQDAKPPFASTPPIVYIVSSQAEAEQLAWLAYTETGRVASVIVRDQHEEASLEATVQVVDLRKR